MGYIPFEPEAANLFFQFISGRYERASVMADSHDRRNVAGSSARAAVNA
ncbi:hypothetical protein [Streptomyces sp. NBC_01571]|nr:hypothetical protein [Streptomyces sp. NBC_01571]